MTMVSQPLAEFPSQRVALVRPEATYATRGGNPMPRHDRRRLCLADPGSASSSATTFNLATASSA